MRPVAVEGPARTRGGRKRMALGQQGDKHDAEARRSSADAGGRQTRGLEDDGRALPDGVLDARGMPTVHFAASVSVDLSGSQAIKEDGSRKPQNTRAKSGGGTREAERTARMRKWSARNMRVGACYGERDAKPTLRMHAEEMETADEKTQDAGRTKGMRCDGDELRAAPEAYGKVKQSKEKRLRRGRPSPDYIEIQAGGTIGAVWEAVGTWCGLIPETEAMETQDETRGEAGAAERCATLLKSEIQINPFTLCKRRDAERLTVERDAECRERWETYNGGGAGPEVNYIDNGVSEQSKGRRDDRGWRANEGKSERKTEPMA
ncbi:hypothetical protein K438DRAFT_1750377 [Mycena galopus ATCC 62051]|nr:hypothetical protein K438DRAFT_1750377 [Mycena galopus ATCC 62051]